MNRTDTNPVPMEVVQADKHTSIYSICTYSTLHIQAMENGDSGQGAWRVLCTRAVLYKGAREELAEKGEGIRLAKISGKPVPGSGHSKCKV